MKSTLRSCLVLSSLVILTASCKKNSNSSNSNNTSGAVSIKYEMVCSAPIQAAPAGLYNYVTYTNSDANGTEERNVINSTNWSKTITLNVTQRPIGIGFSGQTYTGSSGTITSRIYINNELKDEYSSDIFNSGSIFQGFWSNTYILY